jgi:hypothetical protein
MAASERQRGVTARLTPRCSAPPLRACPDEGCGAGRGMLRVEPRAGRAVVFPLALPDELPDASTVRARPGRSSALKFP